MLQKQHFDLIFFLFALACTNFYSILAEPDGLTVARDGTVWGVIWGSHRLRRYSPDGTILQEYQFPTAERITCCTFAGPKLDKLIVTTASQRLAQDGPEADSKPLDDGGSLFVVDTKEELGMKKNIFKEI